MHMPAAIIDSNRQKKEEIEHQDRPCLYIEDFEYPIEKPVQWDENEIVIMLN